MNIEYVGQPLMLSVRQ